MREALQNGDHVIMFDCAEADLYPGQIFVTRSEIWKLGHGAEVIALEGRAGGFSVEKLRKVVYLPDAPTPDRRCGTCRDWHRQHGEYGCCSHHEETGVSEVCGPYRCWVAAHPRDTNPVDAHAHYSGETQREMVKMLAKAVKIIATLTIEVEALKELREWLQEWANNDRLTGDTSIPPHDAHGHWMARYEVKGQLERIKGMEKP